MDKRHEPMFQSLHILCILHKRCTTFYTLIQLGQEASKKKRMLKPKKEITTTADARDTFKRYSTEIKNLMAKYKIQTEAELFGNVILEIPGVFNTYKLMTRDEESVASTIRASVFEIFDRYRKEFLERHKPDWKRDMQSKGDTFHTYMISEGDVTPAMRSLAKMYYELAENDGIFLSFPWIAFEALDLDTPENLETVEDKFLKELKNFSVEPEEVNYEIYEKYYSDFDSFAAAVQTWLLKEDIYQFTSSVLIRKFLSSLACQDNVNPSVTVKTFDIAFLDFLTMICSFKFKNVKTEFRQVYEAAQATLIQLAFSPELPTFSGTSLQKIIDPFPSFVISVPQMYSNQFQDSYQKLKSLTGCTDIAIRLRKTTSSFHHYTICCKGTLESCQKLEDILTPTLEYDHGRTMTLAEMKELKTKTMQKLLENVFGFIPPAHPIPHSNSTSLHLDQGCAFGQS